MLPTAASIESPIALNPKAHYHFLVVPGWHGSEADHWQSHWTAQLQAYRVEQRDWHQPDRLQWVDTFEATLREIPDDRPVILIGHSLGCITIAHWALDAAPALRARVAGALLVAPADVERPDCPEPLQNFAPIPHQPLPFPVHVVASTNDPAVTAQRALALSRFWGAELDVLAGVGHLNVASGHHQWEAGYEFLNHLMRRIEQRLAA